MTRPSRKKWPLVLVAILLITNIATLAFFWSTRAKKKEGNQQSRGRMGQFMVDQMKFDKEQETIYWQMRDTMLNQQRPIMDSMRASKTRFFALLNQGDINDSALAAKTEEIGKLQKQLDMVTFRHFQQIRTICRPDQLQKFDTVIKEIVHRMTFARRPGDKKGDSTIKK
jgi:periplasmic protein CpxP/Spy